MNQRHQNRATWQDREKAHIADVVQDIYHDAAVRILGHRAFELSPGQLEEKHEFSSKVIDLRRQYELRGSGENLRRALYDTYHAYKVAQTFHAKESELFCEQRSMSALRKKLAGVLAALENPELRNRYRAGRSSAFRTLVATAEEFIPPDNTSCSKYFPAAAELADICTKAIKIIDCGLLPARELRKHSPDRSWHVISPLYFYWLDIEGKPVVCTENSRFNNFAVACFECLEIPLTAFWVSSCVPPLIAKYAMRIKTDKTEA